MLQRFQFPLGGFIGSGGGTGFCLGLFLELTLPGRIFGFLITTALTLPALFVLYPVCKSIEAIGSKSND